MAIAPLRPQREPLSSLVGTAFPLDGPSFDSWQLTGFVPTKSEDSGEAKDLTPAGRYADFTKCREKQIIDMSQSKGVVHKSLARSHPHAVKRNLAVAALLSVLAIAAMSFAYTLVPEPTDSLSPFQLAALGAIALIIYFSATTWLFLRIRSAKYPLSGGMFMLVTMTTFFILCFSWIYLVLDKSFPDSFTEPLTKMSAVYFTVAALTTVGFGDITPQGDVTRAIVTTQMVLGVALLGIILRIATQSASETIRSLSQGSNNPSDHPQPAAGDSVADKPEQR
jgi:voltage-gated potassium channel